MYAVKLVCLPQWDLEFFENSRPPICMTYDAFSYQTYPECIYTVELWWTISISILGKQHQHVFAISVIFLASSSVDPIMYIRSLIPYILGSSG